MKKSILFLVTVCALCNEQAVAQLVLHSKTITPKSSFTLVCDASKKQLSDSWTKRGSSSVPLYYLIINTEEKTQTSYTDDPKAVIMVEKIVDILVTTNEIKYFTSTSYTNSLGDNYLHVTTIKKHNGEWIISFSFEWIERIKSIENFRNN